MSSNGIKNSGFNTTGIPKINGSLMKKKVVGKANFPNVLNCELFDHKHIIIASENIDPTPPEIKQRPNDPEMM